ncbi:penicillin-binding protein 2 [Phycicoccus sp. SLBN-51]|uniref:penicillin-binding protein 2 n=1 Tax=Phycicoccus sp. SLBN-51 TaxID=2768447 RepID=UPI001154CDCA|nr:penicillin-binding protein 2 [Phycicoccus sp. SLBN-51]TQJ51394.1 penicillin-binding protein 2 [Phycicoccus sp. SLBN-51]
MRRDVTARGSRRDVTVRGPRRDLTVRVWVFGLVVLSLMGTLLGRLGQVQLTGHADYVAAAETVNTRVVTEPAVRGRILDRNGIPLVDNTSEAVVTLDRKVLVEAADHGEALVRKVARELGRPFDELWGRTRDCGSPGAPPPPVCSSGSPYQPVVVAAGVDPVRALSLLERRDEFPGVDVQARPVRDYPERQRADASHVLGYLARATAEDVTAGKGLVGDSDLVGRSGLEQEYDRVLRGTPGRTTVAVDPRGVVTRTLSVQAPVPGRDVRTHLDLRVQQAAEKALADAVAKARTRGWKADAGAAVVLDVSDGGVVAAASYPAYDPTVWTGGITEGELAKLTDARAGTPLVSRVTSAGFAPASTFKAISLPAAVAAGNRLGGTYDCTSSYRIGNRAFRNFESRAYGPISLHEAMVVSCDTIFYDFAYRSWQAQGGLAAKGDARDPFVRTARLFGLGAPTGVDLPGEQAGRVPGRDWKQQTWEDTRADTCRRAGTGYPQVAATDGARAAYLTSLAKENCRTGFQFRAGDAANFAIGQGDIAVSPLQMARAYAAIGNGGTLWTPQVAQAFADPDGGAEQRIAPHRDGSVGVSPAVLSFLRDALRGVVSEGTAKGAFAGFPLKQWPVAGKTGTAEVYGAQDTSWFVSYAPADKPRYAVAVVVSQGGTGGETAAPAARRIHEVLRTLR